nr:hypothetical protein CFP56_73347 [Quercus suber]
MNTDQANQIDKSQGDWASAELLDMIEAVPYHDGANNSSTGSNLCPISKAQCEQLLAYITASSGGGDVHHAAVVRASSVVGVDGNPDGAPEMNISQPQNNLTSCSNVITKGMNTDQANQIDKSQGDWASAELLDMIEAVPYHEYFIHAIDEDMPRE